MLCDFEIPPSLLRSLHVGDITTIGNQRVKVMKKTNYAVAVEPYRWYHVVEDWLLELAGKLLP